MRIGGRPSIPPRQGSADVGVGPLDQEHARLDSNQRPLPPEGSALSTELRALVRPRLAVGGAGQAENVAVFSQEVLRRRALGEAVVEVAVEALEELGGSERGADLPLEDRRALGCHL